MYKYQEVEEKGEYVLDPSQAGLGEDLKTGSPQIGSLSTLQSGMPLGVGEKFPRRTKSSEEDEEFDEIKRLLDEEVLAGKKNFSF